MAQFPGLMLWTDAWVADTAHLSRVERGTYHDLLVLMWRTPGCRVPNDNQWLAKHMRMTPHEIASELRPLIAEFCQSDGNWLFQKRLQKEFIRAFRTSMKQAARANARWNKEKGLYRGNASAALPPDLESKRESFLSPREKEAAEKKRPHEISRQDLETVFTARHKGES